MHLDEFRAQSRRPRLQVAFILALMHYRISHMPC